MRTYNIPKEISTELKINKALYLFDLMLLLILLVIGSSLSNIIHPSLKWWFVGFLIILGVFLIMRPISNPQKRMYQAVYLALIRNKETYKSIDYENTDGEEDVSSK